MIIMDYLRKGWDRIEFGMVHRGSDQIDTKSSSPGNIGLIYPVPSSGRHVQIILEVLDGDKNLGNTTGTLSFGVYFSKSWIMYHQQRIDESTRPLCRIHMTNPVFNPIPILLNNPF